MPNNSVFNCMRRRNSSAVPGPQRRGELIRFARREQRLRQRFESLVDAARMRAAFLERREVDVRGDVALARIGQHIFARGVPPVSHQRARAESARSPRA